MTCKMMSCTQQGTKTEVALLLPVNLLLIQNVDYVELSHLPGCVRKPSSN